MTRHCAGMTSGTAPAPARLLRQRRKFGGLFSKSEQHPEARVTRRCLDILDFRISNTPAEQQQPEAPSCSFRATRFRAPLHQCLVFAPLTRRSLAQGHEKTDLFASIASRVCIFSLSSRVPRRPDGVLRAAHARSAARISRRLRAPAYRASGRVDAGRRAAEISSGRHRQSTLALPARAPRARAEV